MGMKYRFCFFLDAVAFEKYHGISRADDTMHRYSKFYGTVASHDAYEAASRNLEEHKRAVTHKWATRYGIGSIKGHTALRKLLAGNYYLG